MKKEGHGAARRDMIVGFGWRIESGQDGIYSFGEGFDRVPVAEKDIGTGVNKIEGSEAELGSRETRFRMWTTSRFTVADLVVRAPDRSVEILNTYSSLPPFLRSSLFKRGGSCLGRIGSGEGVGSVGAADMARGIGIGLGVV